MKSLTFYPPTLILTLGVPTQPLAQPPSQGLDPFFQRNLHRGALTSAFSPNTDTPHVAQHLDQASEYSPIPEPLPSICDTEDVE